MKYKTLNPPYGGILINQIIKREPTDNLNHPVIQMSEVQECDVLNIASGIFSPLTGFMNEKNFNSVCDNNSLFESKLTWTIPIVFEITDEQKNEIKNASRVLLSTAFDNQIIGYIEPTEIYKHDKLKRISSTFGTTDNSHPGVALVQKTGNHLLAGKVFVFEDAVKSELINFPKTIREQLTFKNLNTVAGFQTRNVVHRAHEYLQRIALETCDGLLVHPIVGWKKKGDFKKEVVEHSYQEFIKSYYPKQNVHLAFLKTAMRYAGPKEAVFHAIIRKNFGCSHFIVGRDHAGVGNFYETYAAHDFIKTLPDIGIEFLLLKEPFYCNRCESIASEKSCGHPDTDRDYISGTKIRSILTKGSDPSKHIFRPEVLDSLSKFQIEGLFYE